MIDRLFRKAFILFFSILVFSCNKEDIISKEINGEFLVNSGGINNQLNDMAIDQYENIYITGNLSGSKNSVVSFGKLSLTAKGAGDGFIAKYNGLGNLLWAKILGASNEEGSNVIGVDNLENIYVAGFFRDETNFEGTELKIEKLYNSSGSSNMLDMFLAKYDKDGNQMWVKKISGVGYERPTAIQIDHNGSMYATGYFNSNIRFDSTLFSTDDSGFFITSYNPNGKLSWAKIYGQGQGSIYPSSMKFNSKGSILITGSFMGTKNIDGTIVSSVGDQDAFLAEFTNNGNLVWIKTFGGTMAENSRGLSIDAKDDIYIGGFFRDSMTIEGVTLMSIVGDAFIMKFSKSGSFQWVEQVGGSGEDYIFDVKENNGKIYYTGYYDRNISFGDTTLSSNNSLTGFVAKHNSDGKFELAHNLDTNSCRAYRISINGKGYTILAGNFSHSLAINNLNVLSSGHNDNFVAKYILKDL